MPDYNDRPRNITANPGKVEPEKLSEPEKVRLVEVDLQRKYCPFFLVNEDGSVAPNVKEKGSLDTIEPGIVRVHPKDAQHLMIQGLARGTMNTFREASEA